METKKEEVEKETGNEIEIEEENILRVVKVV